MTSELAAGRPRVSVLDLRLDALARIELEVGLPASRWSDAPSMARLLTLVYAAATGTPIDQVEAMTLRELQDLVDLEGDEGPADPT
jgi:hypothetical protein